MLESKAEIVQDLISGRGVVHVEYRYGGRGRWRGFYLVPDVGEAFESVASKIVPAIEAHHAARVAS